MGFFGAVFVSLTMYWQWHVSGVPLALPLGAFVIIAALAIRIARSPGIGLVPSRATQRTIMWSSMAEGAGILVATNVVLGINRPALLLPAVALVVGLHFVPIAIVSRYNLFSAVAAAMILTAIAGLIIPGPSGGEIAGLSAAAVLWIAAIQAVRRDWVTKRSSVLRSAPTR